METPAPSPRAVRNRSEHRRPRVSVLIPNYNYARYLPEAIGSVLRQDLPDFELVIIDDGSSDESAAVIRQFADADDRIRFRINAKNRGMVENWNDCLFAARGEYVRYLLADDRLPADSSLKKLVALIEQRPGTRLVASAREIIDERSDQIAVLGYAPEPFFRKGTEVIVDCVSQITNLIGEPSAVLFRRADAERGFDAGYNQLVDLEMWLHLLESGDFAYTPELLCSFRRHPMQQTEVNQKKGVHRKDFLRLVREYRQTVLATGGKMALYRCAYQIGKWHGQTEDSVNTVREIHGTLGGWRHPCWVVHRIRRPFENLSRALRKRSRKPVR